MMSRDVKIIRTDRYYWIISIDDKIVQLSRYRYVQQHLLRYPEFNSNIEQSSSTAKLEDSLKEIERLKALLSKSRNQNRRISAELLACKAKCKDLELQNERLAGQCQKLGEMKLIRL